MAKPSIRAYANCDDAYVVWRYPEPIPDCRGFALMRRAEGKAEEPVHTFVPPVGEKKKAPDESRPSTEWPIQKYAWADFLVKPGDRHRYRVVPVLADKATGKLKPAKRLATPWSDEVTIGPAATPEISAYFNRGVLATQALARRLGPVAKRTTLEHAIDTPGDKTRNWLGGELRLAMKSMLDGVRDNPKATLYAALYELEDPELIEWLSAIAGRANVVLANGAKRDDGNKHAREALKEAKVKVHDRLTGSRFAHNKFVVVCEDDVPLRVWTGSTNWSKTGLCTQVNNGLMVEDEGVAAYYRGKWDSLKKAGSEFPQWLVNENDTAQSAPLDKGEISTWFTPTHKQVDLAGARELIDAAKNGILFLMFNPGPKGTLFNDIMARADETSPRHDAKLYVHGVLNQDPQGGQKDPALVGLIHRGKLDKADPAIVLPSKVDGRFESWDEEIQSYNIVMVHSKLIVLDPFGEKPVVITGSHNLGPRASQKNDDNLNLIRNVPELAQAYAVNIMAIYNNYRWRYVNSPGAKSAGNAWKGPKKSDAWQKSYFRAPQQREMAFWLGES